MTDAPSKKTILDVAEYRAAPEQFIAPTEAELRARNKRNYALAAALAAFMLFVFVTMITRANGGA
ncbi:MAG: hypothetical protein ACPGVT_10610 [Maricaulaceae bacterium]